jgi:hypothetical protein
LLTCTNGYEKYLNNLILSSLNKFKTFSSFKFYIFTDNPTRVEQFKNYQNQQFLEVIPINTLGWPDASLKRFEIYWKYKELFEEEILVSIDADMYFLQDLVFEKDPSDWNYELAFVSHPGYSDKLVFRSTQDFLRRISRRIRYGGDGSWETSKSSTAFVPRRLRKTYCCGGVWFGRRISFLDTCKILAEKVWVDKDNGVMPIWHDESYLNSLVAALENPTILSSRYCYDPNLGNHYSSPIILAVNKSLSLKSQLARLEMK